MQMNNHLVLDCFATFGRLSECAASLAPSVVSDVLDCDTLDDLDSVDLDPNADLKNRLTFDTPFSSSGVRNNNKNTQVALSHLGRYIPGVNVMNTIFFYFPPFPMYAFSAV
jgi:hypothetical protein